jgi:hypothetical protein
MGNWHPNNASAMAPNQTWHKSVHMIEKRQLYKQAAGQHFDATTRIGMRVGKQAGSNPFGRT